MLAIAAALAVSTASAQSLWSPTPCCILALPDLVALDVVSPSGAYAGDNIAYDLEGYAANDGMADAGGFSTAWYLSADATFDASDTLLLGGRDVWSGLTQGSLLSTPYYTSIVVPSTMASGHYHLLFVVDEFSEIYEWDETNNVISAPFEVY